MFFVNIYLCIKNTLKEIEKQILKNHETINNIEWSFLNGDLPSNDGESLYYQEEARMQIKILEIRRQHLLDKRNGWIQRIVFNIAAPVLVSVVTTYILLEFGLISVK